MPKNTNDHGSQSMDQEARFRDFFTTSVVDIPAEMVRREAEQREKEAHKGVLGRLFGRTGREEPQAAPGLELPTGEILLGADARPEAEEDLALNLRTADPGADLLQPLAEPGPAPQAAVQQDAGSPKEPPKPARRAAPRHEAPRHEKKNKRKEPLLPQEKQEHREMQAFREMLNGMENREPPAASQPETAPENRTEIVFAATRQKPEPKSVFQMFGSGTDERTTVQASEEELDSAPRFIPEPETEPQNAPAPDKEDTMSLPLLTTEEAAEPAGAAAKPDVPETDGKETDAAQPTAAEEVPPEEPAVPETPQERLHRMNAELTLRCVLSGILAVVLLHFGLAADRLLPPVASLDPDVAPAAFYAANLLLYAASLVVGYPVLREGLRGLKERPSAETMPALAAAAGLLQAVVALLTAGSYRATQGLSLLTGAAALGLFLALLGSRILLTAVQSGYELVSGEIGTRCAYRVKDKDLIRALARDLEEKDPWVLLSRVRETEENFVEKSLGERASERRTRKIAYILLGVAVFSGLACLIVGRDIKLAAAAMAAVLCMGAPLSSTLVAGVAALRLQRTAAAFGAVVPGWSAIEELGGIDTIEVDSDELFPSDSVELKDIRIFKGGRIDRAILYAASVLHESCETLWGMLQQIIEGRTDILFPVKDLEIHHGLGFSAWCDNNRVLIGNRRYMDQEGVPQPEEEYEKEHSKNGELQILYLAVSGSLHAMFVLRYVGGRNVKKSLEGLKRENIRLLVNCLDPSLTAKHITEAYHLPEDMVVLLDQEQCAAVEHSDAATDGDCCMYHAKGFASMTGGLQAADRAQNAETAATTVQIVSVIFSAAIALLLTSAGSIWQMGVATVLMYQAGWSGLSIAVCALKQHN